MPNVVSGPKTREPRCPARIAECPKAQLPREQSDTDTVAADRFSWSRLRQLTAEVCCHFVVRGFAHGADIWGQRGQLHPQDQT